MVAPVGMTEEGRAEWLSVAWITLQDLPADLLALGCAEARKTCDHPSKLVPAIIAATKASLALRRQAAEPYVSHRIEGQKPSYVTADEASSILKQYGLRS